MRVGVLAATRAEAETMLVRLDLPWLDCFPFGLESPSLHEDFNFAGVSALVAKVDPGPALAMLLGHLEATNHGDRPLVIVTEDAREAPWCQAFRYGVVELVPMRRLVEPVLRACLLEQDRRPGLLRGNGAFNELGQLFASLTHFGRTGTLEVRLPAGPGRLRLLWGRLERTAGVPLDDAGAPMLPANAPWSFLEERPPGPPVVQGFEPLVNEPPLLEAELAGPTLPTAADVRPNEVSLLVVDDDPTVLRMLRDSFSRRGFQVQAAGGGEEALQALAARSFDVTILDLDMPRVDGWQVLGAMREDVRTWDTQVLLFSAHDHYRDVLAHCGPSSHAAVPKTTRLLELERHVRELMLPRLSVERRLAEREVSQTLTFDALDRVGIGWFLHALERHHVTGTVTGSLAQARFALWFSDGRLVQAQGVFPEGRCAGLDALRLVLASRPRALRLEDATVPQGEGFERHPTGSILSVVTQRLAIEQHHLQQLAVSRAVAVRVNEALYRLYAGIGSALHRSVARALCEQHVAPQQLSAQLGLPQEAVTHVLRELVRRGVIHLEPGPQPPVLTAA